MMGWLFDFEDEKKKKEKADSFVNGFLNACKDKDKLDEWKTKNSDNQKEKDTFSFFF